MWICAIVHKRNSTSSAAGGSGAVGGAGLNVTIIGINGETHGAAGSGAGLQQYSICKQ